MSIPAALDQLTVEEKIAVMETIWDDLCRRAEGFPMPSWHADELHQRDARLAAGAEHTEDWGTAKARIRTQA